MKQINATPEEEQILYECETCGIRFFSEKEERECFQCGSTELREIPKAPQVPNLKGKYVFEKKGYDPLELLGVIEHFNGSKWWLFENTGCNVFFCYARLSGMEEFAEFGYTCIDEIFDAGPNFAWYVEERDFLCCDFVRRVTND